MSQALVDRLSTRLPRDAQIQQEVSLVGDVYRSLSKHTSIEFVGVVDALHEEKVFELKYVSELSHSMFLQLALYLVMSGLKAGVLWNTRTDECWQVEIPDRDRFMDAVALCVTKQSYKAFRG